MTTSNYTYLLNHPNAVSGTQLDDLQRILVDYPYLQSARALLLKGLYNQQSFLYNDHLKRTAAYTQDRSVLFEFITSAHFKTIDYELYQKKLEELFGIEVFGFEVIKEQVDLTGQDKKLVVKENPVAFGIDFENIAPPIPMPSEKAAEVIALEEKLEIGKPLQFERSEKHTFQEWLQLTAIKPIVRTESNQISISEEKKVNKQLDIIDRFIENNPKIVPLKKDDEIPVKVFESPEKPSLMTETLAKIYLEQKKYSQAIQAYDILILKYPEKSVFFANRIEEIKQLQNIK